MNIPILEELYQDTLNFEALLDFNRKEKKIKLKTRSLEFEKVIIILYLLYFFIE